MYVWERARRSYAWILFGCFMFSGCRDADSKATAPDAATPLSLMSAQQVAVSAPVNDQTTLFERLDPAACGIDFQHLWQPRDRHEAILLKTGFTGGGVCRGDFNDDGLSDLRFTRPHGGTRLYQNEGGFRFRDVTDAAGVGCSGAWTTGAAFVDVNRDGRLDIVVCAYESENFLFLNLGEGRFEDVAPKVGLAFAGATVKLSFADYDADGDLDAYLLTNRREPRDAVKVRYEGTPGHYTVAPEHRELVMVINLPSGEQKFAKAGQVDRLYKNELAETGSLRFRDVTSESQIAGYYHGLDVIWWDFNRDSHPDLYVANDFTDPDQFYRNNGDGTFTDVTQSALPCTPWFAMGAACGDVNNDGRFDLLATDMNGTSHYRQKMAMGDRKSVV